MTNNPYFIEDEAIVSFSGGRTSGCMLYNILEAHDFELPDYVKVCFANTGKEMPQTLDFVKRVQDEWGVDIVWLERFARLADADDKNMYRYDTEVVTYETASRNGEPFSSLIQVRQYAPNPVARFCTSEMKVRAISSYVEGLGFERPYLAYMGIRADEPRRAVKILGRTESGQEAVLPLYTAGVTAADVGRFWNSQSFDLELPNNNGVTDWGNCDLCFLKGLGKKLSIIRERPDLADWWIEQEEKLSEQVGKGAYFRADQPSYKKMKEMATTQGQLFAFEDDETIPCFCGD